MNVLSYGYLIFCLVILFPPQTLFGELPAPRDEKIADSLEDIRPLFPNVIPSLTLEQKELVLETFRWLSGDSRNETGLSLSYAVTVEKLAQYFKRASPLTKQQLLLMKRLVFALSNKVKRGRDRSSEIGFNSHLCAPQEALRFAEEWILEGLLQSKEELDALIWAAELSDRYDKLKSFAFLRYLVRYGHVKTAAAAAAQKGFNYEQYGKKVRDRVDSYSLPNNQTPSEVLEKIAEDERSAIPVEANWWPTRELKEEFKKTYHPSLNQGPLPEDGDFLERSRWLRHYFEFRSPAPSKEDLEDALFDFAGRSELTGENLSALGENYLVLTHPAPVGMNIPPKKAIEILRRGIDRFKIKQSFFVRTD